MSTLPQRLNSLVFRPLAFTLALSATTAWAQAPAFNCNFGTQSIGRVEMQLNATGGNGTYTWTLASGTLPPGMAIRSDGAEWFPANVWGLSGIATTPGTYNFSLTGTSAGLSTTNACSIKITSLSFKDHWDLNDGYLGQPYSAQLHAQDALGPFAATWSPVLPPFGQALPTGMTLSAGGLLSGTPTQTGYFNLNLRITDGLDTVYRNYNLSITDLRFTSSPVLPSATQNMLYGGTTITAAGGTPPYTFTSSSMVPGLTLDPGGQVTGTANTGPGKFSFSVTVTDSVHHSYFRQMSLNVIGVPKTLPSITPYGPFLNNCTIGYPCSQGFGVYNGGVPPFTWTATGMPAGMDMFFGDTASTWMTPGDSQLKGVPMAAGNFDVQVTVTDAEGASATNTFRIHVSELLQTNYNFGGTIETFSSVKLRLIGGDNTYTVSDLAGKYPNGVSLNPATFVVSGIPHENGSFSNTYSFSDGSGHALQTTNYYFISGGTSTVSFSTFYDLGTAQRNVSFSRTLFACCLPAYQWSVEAGSTLPPGLTLNPSSGVLGGTPTTNGVYTFMIRVSDLPPYDANHAVREFRLAVSPLGFSGNSQLPFANVSSLYSQTLSVSGGVGTVSWALAPGYYLPPGITLSSAGVFSGTPTGSGQFFFTVIATDSSTPGAPFVRSYSLAVFPPGGHPPVQLNTGGTFGPFTVGQVNISLNAQDGQPPYTFSMTGGTIPGMRLQNGPPLPTFFSTTTTAGLLGVLTTSGTYTRTLRVTDSSPGPDNFIERSITIRVTSLNSLSQNTLPRGTKGTPYSFQFTATGGSGNYSWESNGSLPSTLTLSSTGLLSGTPAGLLNATQFTSVPYRLRDLTTGDSVTFSPSLTVDAFAISPGAVLPQATVGTFYTQTFSANCGSTCAWNPVSVPGGLSLVANTTTGTATLSGTPTSTINTTFTVQASGSAGTVSKIYALRIGTSPAQPLSITTASSISPSTVGNSALVTLFVQGGTPPYTWSLTSGSLPPGVSLGGPGETLGGNLLPGFTYLTGKLTTVGNHTFELTASDASTSVSRTFTWYVSPIANQYFGLPLPGTTLIYGTAYSQQLLATGGTGAYTWTNLTAMPTGLTLDPAGTVSGAPTSTGPTTTTVQAIDDNGDFITASLTFNVAGPAPGLLFISPGSNLGLLPAGSSPSFTITATLPNGSTPAGLDIQPVGALPAGFALLHGNSITGTGVTNPSAFVLSATALTPGPFTFALRAQDSSGNVGVRTFFGTVSTATLATGTLPDGSIGAAYSQQIQNVAGGSLSWTVPATSSLPPGLSLSPGGLLSGTPTTAGTFTFTLNASVGGTVVLTPAFALRISNVRITNPQIIPVSAIAGQEFHYTFAATVSSGGAPTFSAIGLPFGFSLNGATGELSGTTFSTASTISFQVTATNGGTQITQRFTFYSRYGNRAPLDYPVASTLLADMTAGFNSTVVLNGVGGTPPYSWSVAAGSSLPNGLGLYPASVSAVFPPGATLLAGIPTVAGQYSFELTLTDSTGAQTRRLFSLKVSSIGILANALRPIQTGTVYDQRLTAIGGTAPYTFTIATNSPIQDVLPPGLAFSSEGTITGTPTATGNFSFRARVQDAGGNSFIRTFSYVVTTPTGLMVTNSNPSGGWAGRRVDMSLSTNSNHAFNWSVIGSLPPGLVLAVGQPYTNTGDTLLSGQIGTPGIYSFTVRATDTAATGNLGSADHIFTMKVTPTQPVSPPTPLLRSVYLPNGNVGTPYTFTFKVAGGTSPYTFTVSPFAPVLPPGLSLSPQGVLSGTPTATGTFVVTVVVTDNTGALQPIGALLIVTAAGTPAPLEFAGSSQDTDSGSVGVPFDFALDEGSGVRGGVTPFTWTVAAGSSLPPGMVLLPGSGAVPARLGGIPTTSGEYQYSLILTDAVGQTQTVPFQTFVSSLVLSPNALPSGIVGSAYAVSLAAAGGTSPYTFHVIPPLDFPPGLSLTSGGGLTGTPTYPGNFFVGIRVVDAMGAELFRFLRITVDNAAGQAPALTLAPKPIQVFATGTGAAVPPSVPVTISATSGNIPFSLAVSGIPGASLSASSGTTPATITLNFSSLPIGTYVGAIGAAGLESANRFDSTTVAVTIAPLPPCSWTLSPTDVSSPSTGTSGSFDVSTSSHCSWTATTPDSWIHITSTPSGTGSGTVNYMVSSNPDTQRIGTISVGGRSFRITQFAFAGCSLAINPSSLSATATGGTASISVTASDPSCGWTASGLAATPGSGTGNGSVTVTIPPNASPSSQTYFATIATQTLQVSQTGINCTVGLSPYSGAFTATGGSGSIDVSTPAGCAHDSVVGPGWISITSGGSGTGPGSVVYSVSANSTTLTRSGNLTIGGQTFQVTQDALACSVTLNTSALGSPYSSSGGSGSMDVITNGSNCGWSASSIAPWAVVSPPSGIGNGTVNVSLSSANVTPAARTTDLTVGGQTIPISQAGIICTFSLQSSTGSVPAAGAAGNVGVVAPGSCGWSSSSNDSSWLTISSSGSGGTSSVQFVAGANLAAAQRTGTLTIAGLTYPVTQAAAECSYTLGSSSTTIAADGFTGTVPFSTGASGCSPTAVSYAGWISVSTAFSGGSGTVNYTVAANTGGSNRSGIIQLGTQTFTVMQGFNPGACAFSLNAYGALYSSAGGSGSVLGSPNAEGCEPVTGTNQPGFIALDAVTGPVGHVFTQPFMVGGFSSLTPAIRVGNITFGGQIFRIKQTSY